MESTAANTSLFHPVDIGSVHLSGNIFLAPLAGYTDRAFRSLCISHGASFTYSEMVSAEGVARMSVNTDRLMARANNETLFAVQIFTSEASVVERCLSRLVTFNPTVIDINCGCPVPKVVKTGAGSALLREPGRIHEIVKVLKEGCDVPVSVKIRLGWDANSINYLETSDAALSAGADMITMHARTKTMGYAGTADWHALAELKRFASKRNPSVPIFGSGDLFSAQAAKELLETTGIDGVMLARGAIGNPFIFEDTIALLTTGRTPSPHTIVQKVEAMRTQLHHMGTDIGEIPACREMRKHAAAYLKGIPHASKAKRALVRAASFSEYEVVFSGLTQGDGEYL